MQVSELRGYGVAMSDLEGAWPPEVKRAMKRKGKAVVLRSLGPLQRVRFLYHFVRARGRARRLDLAAIRARGVTNEAFLATQLEYLALFTALARVVGRERAVEILYRVMEETAREPMLLTLPEPGDVRRFPDALAVFREWLRAGQEASCRVGCHQMIVREEGPDAVQMDVTWCVWLELARLMGDTAACLPNCHADQLVFPDYFRGLGIEYRRTQTLASGGRCCDFRFERARP